MKLADEPKGEWFEYIRELLPLHIIAPIAIGVVKNSKEMIGCPFTRILVASENDKSWWCNCKKDIYSVGEFLISKLRDKDFSRNYYKRYGKFYSETQKICEHSRNEDLSKLSNKKLLEKYNFLYENMKRYHALSFDIDAMDIVLEEKMKKKFWQLMEAKYKTFKKSEFNSGYSILTTPSELSYVSREQLKIYNIAKGVEHDKKLLKLFLCGDADKILDKIEKDCPKLKQAIMLLAGEYWWTSLGWTARAEKGMKSFILDIKNILKENSSVVKEMQRLKNFIKNVRAQKKRLDGELGFDKEISLYLGIFEHYALLHDYRKEIQMKGTAAMNKFLFEIARRYKKKYEDLVWCWPSEIQNYIKNGRIRLNEIRKRKKALFILVAKSGIEQHTGEKAIKRRNEELLGDVEIIRDFKGVIASIGKAAGKAKICYSAAEAIKKIQKGDILVASMTLPQYLPAMKKAAAIVTDEGGITSHAAIISRELKIPCIVGTRIATRVLKDNDIIEVNANHGAVKILGEYSKGNK